MFNESSGLVQIWINLIHSGAKTLQDVPPISNLREIVQLVLEGEE